MPWQIRLAAKARQDIEQALINTLERFGQAKHDEYRDLIRSALVDIASSPEALPAKSRPELHPNAYTFHIGRVGQRARHFFIYRIAPDDAVDVARLLYDGMDIERYLPEDYLKR